MVKTGLLSDVLTTLNFAQFPYPFFNGVTLSDT